MIVLALRGPDVVMTPACLGAARSNRHSFSRSLLRAAAAGRWTVDRAVFDIDVDGQGEAIYRVDAAGVELHFVVFSQALQEHQRTDRVIAEAWDATAALVEGPVDDEVRAELRRNVPVQEAGRAARRTLVWGRANRSSRYFSTVVSGLAAGRQPAPDDIGDDAYLMRSTAFYGNGKFGLVDFDGYGERHPLRVPYRSQMLAAWLLREFSLDLAEHCARLRNPNAAVLDDEWRRFFGLGNATGLGLVPYAFQHPAVLDRWITIRERARANAVAVDVCATTEGRTRVDELLGRALRHFEQRRALQTDPYPRCPEIAAGINRLRSDAAKRPLSSGDLLEAAADIGPEVEAVVESILVELDDTIDAELEQLLHADEPAWVPTTGTCGDLLERIECHYRWVDDVLADVPDDSHYFWYMSANSLEPRRGVRGVEEAPPSELTVGVAPAMRALRHAVRNVPPDRPGWQFALEHPEHSWALDRLATVPELTYGEPRVNALAKDFMPLDLQRAQLAMYGMENFSPQSTDWLRVTLYSGAPRADDVAAGVSDGCVFPVMPTATPSTTTDPTDPTDPTEGAPT